MNTVLAVSCIILVIVVLVLLATLQASRHREQSLSVMLDEESADCEQGFLAYELLYRDLLDKRLEIVALKELLDDVHSSCYPDCAIAGTIGPVEVPNKPA